MCVSSAQNTHSLNDQPMVDEHLRSLGGPLITNQFELEVELTADVSDCVSVAPTGYNSDNCMSSVA